MSNSSLYDELVAQGYTVATAPATTADVIYLKNQIDTVRKIQIRTATGHPNTLADLVWQNPTLKQSLDDPNAIKACLEKGLIPVKLYPVALDEVAFESATSNITTANATLSFSDYSTVIGENDDVSVTMNHGISGNRFTIHGLMTDTFDLSTLNQVTLDGTPIFEYGSYSWTARQVRNSLVYTADGKPVIPIYVKWNISEADVIPMLPFTSSEINGTIGIVEGTSPANMQINYAGFAPETRYETQVLVVPYACEHKYLEISTVVFTIPTDNIKGLFSDVLSANAKYNSSVVYEPIEGNIVTGTANQQLDRNEAFLTARIPQVAYEYLELLQWTNPDLTVLRLNNIPYSVQAVMDMARAYTYNSNVGPVTEYHIPIWLHINAYGTVAQAYIVDVGYGGLTVNNDWTVEQTTMFNNIAFADPLANPGPSTVLDLSTANTSRVSITIDGVTTEYENVEAMLLDNKDIRLVDSGFWVRHF